MLWRSVEQLNKSKKLNDNVSCQSVSWLKALMFCLCHIAVCAGLCYYSVSQCWHLLQMTKNKVNQQLMVGILYIYSMACLILSWPCNSRAIAVIPITVLHATAQRSELECKWHGVSVLACRYRQSCWCLKGVAHSKQHRWSKNSIKR